MKNFRSKQSLVQIRRATSAGIVLLALILGGCGNADIATLTAQLSDRDQRVRYDAAKALEDYGSQAAPAVQELGKCLRDDDPGVRYRAAKALSKIGHASVGSIAELSAALASDPDSEVRYYAAKTIDQFADEASPAIDALVKARQPTKIPKLVTTPSKRSARSEPMPRWR